MFDLSKVWPEWTVEEKLGEGAYGCVCKCVRRERGITSYCAIKKITIPRDAAEIELLKLEGFSEEASKAYFDDIVDNFANEIGVMENLKGFPNIVSVEDYKIIEHENGIGWDIYIRMELLTSFQNHMQSNPLNEQDVIKLGIDICSALEACEKHGVIHRDVKPDNIFIDKNGKFKLGDFGVARQLEKTRSTMSDRGTPSYIAPEVVKERKYDHRVDIYSLGMVMYKLLNRNRDPFLDTEKQMIRVGERMEANRRRLNGDELDKPVEASEEAAEIILKACSYNPDNRFISAAEMKKELQSLLDSAPTSVEEKPIVTTPVTEEEKTVISADIPETKAKKTPQKCFSSPSFKKIVAIVLALSAVFLAATGFKFGVFGKKANETTTSQTASHIESTAPISRQYLFSFQEPEQTTAAGFVETYCEATALYSDGRILKIVEFGSYPQRLVEDNELLNELNNLELEWKSYGYYSGKGTLNFGSMKQSDYMEYADVEYNGSKYRAVWIKDYRPLATTGEHTILSDQYINGYYKGNVYWFKYEPIQWGIVDEEAGYLVSMDIIDAQPFSNEAYIALKGSGVFNDSSAQFPVNDYESSSIRIWLNNDFYNTAFSEEEKLMIKTSYVDNYTYNNEEGTYSYRDTTYDEIFLPSYTEVNDYLNDEYHLSGYATDYAASQSLNINSETHCSPWSLRTSTDSSSTICVDSEGIFDHSQPAISVGGIRPALCVENP